MGQPRGLYARNGGTMKTIIIQRSPTLIECIFCKQRNFPKPDINGAVTLSSLTEDPTAKINEYIDKIQAQEAQAQVELQEAVWQSIFGGMEDIKEKLKKDMVTFVKATPSGLITDFTSSYSWWKTSLIEILVYQYSQYFQGLGLGSPSGSTKPLTWLYVSTTIGTLTNKQIQGMP
jgi:hypothetical protein